MGSAVSIVLKRVGTAQLVGSALVVALALFVVPTLFGGFWMGVMREWVIYSLVALSLTLLVGRVGIYSLCQIPLVAAGAWFAMRLFFAFGGDDGAPFLVVAVLAASLTAVLGVIIGLPALRLSGLYLALVTLMAAGAATLLLVTIDFPNGGSGFWGVDSSSFAFITLPRPGFGTSDLAFFRFSVVLAAVVFAIVLAHVLGKPGRAWAAIRQSELTAVSAGINTTVYKLWAFGLSAFIAGLAGVMIAANSGATTSQFPVQDSILLLATVLLAGVYSLWGAVIAGFFMRVVNQLISEWWDGAPDGILLVVFGVGVILTLVKQPRGLVDDLGRLSAGIGSLVRSQPSDAAPAAASAPSGSET